MPRTSNLLRALLLGLALLATPRRADAEPAPETRPFPLRVSVLNESISLPSPERLFSRLNPGAEVGTELTYQRTRGYTLFQSFNLGLFHHPGFSTSAYVDTAFGYRSTLLAGLFAELSLGIGYLANVSALPLYVQEEGVYRRASPLLHRFIARSGVGLGYQVGSLSPFITYSLMIEAPFLRAFSPVLPHQLMQLGVRIQFPLLGSQEPRNP
jgi:hypothetical protein